MQFHVNIKHHIVTECFRQLNRKYIKINKCSFEKNVYYTCLLVMFLSNGELDSKFILILAYGFGNYRNSFRAYAFLVNIDYAFVENTNF